MPNPRLLCLTAFVALSCSGASQNIPDINSFPLAFEPNMGQTPAQVSYLVQRPSHQVLITSQSLTYIFPISAKDAPTPKPRSFTFRWTGPTGTPHFTPKGPLAGRSNYFLSPDAARGIANVPHYSELREEGALRGVDIRYHSGSRGELEYDLILSGRTAVSDVGMIIEGADHLRVEEDGALSILRGDKEWLRQPVPQAYEMRNGRRIALRAMYTVNDGNRVSFSVPARTPGKELVIDPVVAYGTLLGVHDPMYRWADEGGPYSHGLSTAVDPAGNFFVAGQTYAFDFPVTRGALQTECPWTPIACVYTPLDFVTKFSSSGQLLYSTYLGGDLGYSPYHEPTGKMLAVDGNGYAYIAGEAVTGGFPVTTNAYQTVCHSGNGCATLTKLNQSGSALVYSTYFGGVMDSTAPFEGPSDTYANALALASNGDVFLAGGTRNPYLPTTPGAYQYSCPMNSAGCKSGYVARFNLNTSGSASRIFATYVGTPDGATEISSIAVDRYDDVYALGLSTVDVPFIASFGTGKFPFGTYGGVCYTLGADCETFVAKLSGNYGQALRDATILRGVAGKSIAVDSSLNAFIGGAASLGLATTPGAFQSQFRGGSTDGFVTKLDASGYIQLYSTFLGGTGDDAVSDIAVNSWGMAFVTGFTSSTDFPLGAGAFGKTPSSGYVTAFNADGRRLYYSSFIGGGGGAGISLDKAWNAILTGTGSGTTPLTSNAVQTQMAGFDDAFALKVAIAADLRLSNTTSATSIARNGVVIYHARVLNAGPDSSDKVVFTDAIPAGMSYAGVYVPNGDGCTGPNIGATTGVLTCRKARLEPGQTWYVNVYLRAIGSSGTKITNQLKTSAGTQDLWQTNNSTSSTVTIQ
ncbi:DUF11 domain-containing protein [Occallatibacter riparius]|uniref:DUF11 domain-containing protein n=1 Tax=Occallatibacter riparius TaxID=1002689 RepID=A0A9J7BIM1_9BACT|nr:DUF11 domain-containing protein [Occallatibacter riparius]UWZ82535.1 DUF11 domain-containing protein [Occallatibacter riparius]